jgi:hypothetical protein
MLIILVGAWSAIHIIDTCGRKSTASRMVSIQALATTGSLLSIVESTPFRNVLVRLEPVVEAGLSLPAADGADEADGGNGGDVCGGASVPALPWRSVLDGGYDRLTGGD